MANFNKQAVLDAAAAIDGWMNALELAWLAEQASTKRIVVEIGSWKGRSTKALALAVQDIVYSVDHWLDVPPPSEASKTKGDWKEVSERGSKALRSEFERNLAPEIAAGKCVALGLPSSKGAVKLAEMLGGRKVDMVFIDGDHDYEMIKQDIRLWRPMISEGGLLCGHDYHQDWPGVLAAVGELVPRHWRIPDTMIWYGQI